MNRTTAFFLLAAASLALLLPACDNPACVFGGTCVGQSISGALGTEPASIPAAGEQILPGAPTLLDMFPTGTAVDVQTPLVVVFSESMSSQFLNAAFELQATGIGAIPLQAAALVGDGHMVVLFPLTELLPSQEYTLRFRTGVKVIDRTGQIVAQPANGNIGTFTTAAADPAGPTVVATWPENATTNQSPTTEIDVVFSRPMDEATIGDPSWVVTVNGVAPPTDPPPQPVTISGLVSDTRVYRWRAADSMGEHVSLGTNANVRLELSPAGSIITDFFGAPLPNTVVTFTTLPFSAPVSASITNEPLDAIGINQISGPSDLAVRVELADAQAGDKIGLLLFGKQPQPAIPVPVENLLTIALLREVDLEAPFTEFTFTASEVDLVISGSPLRPRFTDGTVAFAFYVKRGSAFSPVTLLDVDSNTAGTQSPVLDSIAPVLLGLSTSGNTVTTFRSDARGLVLVGRASEALRAALVETASGTNAIVPGELPSVTGAHASGLFVAARVRVGVLPSSNPTLAYTLTIYDRALNTATPVNGVFTQVGQASNGVPGPFTNVTIEVFNATNLAPVVGATVHVHENLFGSTSLVDTGTTDTAGRVVLAPALLGETIVTVVASGFELFTFDNLPTDSVSIPLRPAALGTASTSGNVSTTDTSFAVYQKGISDTRFPTPGETVLLAGTCSFSTQAQALQCAFGPTAIRSRELGAQSAVVTLDPPSPFLYSAPTFLKAFSLSLPMPPAEPGTTQTNTLVMGSSLDLGTLDPEERPIDVPPSVLSTVNWPTITGDPRVRIEGSSPGLAKNVTVGRGIAFDDALPPDTWAVRAAYPGSVDGVSDVAGDELGRFVKSQTFDADLLLRVEVVDPSGNRGGVRPRLSVAGLMLVPPPPPTPGPMPFVPNGTRTLDFSFPDVLPDAAAQAGIYRVVLTDGVLTWTIWRLDAPDANGPDGVVHLPLVGAGGTFPFAPGNIGARVSVFAWPTFDVTRFMWSDVEREFDLFAHTASVVVSVP